MVTTQQPHDTGIQRDTPQYMHKGNIDLAFNRIMACFVFI